MYAEIIENLHDLQNQEKARIMRGFFKTAPGQYGEGDVFLGIPVAVLRKLARQYRNPPPDTVLALLRHSFHEARLLALLFLIRAFRNGDSEAKKIIFNTYLDHTRFINNWDLVDLSAPHIIGGFLADKKRTVLSELATSGLLWERRMAIVATFHFIRNGEFQDTLHVSDLLLRDREDLIHKAVGWMLREVGKRDAGELENYLKPRCKIMPRTMLRYAVEKFPGEKRQKYLDGSI